MPLPNPPNSELEDLLGIARRYRPSDRAEPYIDNGAVLIPFDLQHAGGGWSVQWERATNRDELLEALGY